MSVVGYFALPLWKQVVQLCQPGVLRGEIRDEVQVFRLVVDAKVLDDQDFVERQLRLLFFSPVHELYLPVLVRRVDFELLEGHPHRKQIL